MEVRTEEYYIYLAVDYEKQNEIGKALQAAQEGYRKFPNNYELLFMSANYSYLQNGCETAYVKYLMALSLCENEDRKIIEDNWRAIDTRELNADKVRESLKEMIEERIKLREYVGTYKIVTNIVFSSDAFLFKKIIDQWLRYYYMMLEITSCEMQRGVEKTTAEIFLSWKELERAVTLFKFVFRRIWFGIPQKNPYALEELIKEYGVSADFLAVVGKYSVHESYVASVLLEVAKILSESNCTEHATILRQYGVWIAGVQKENKEVMIFEGNNNNLNVFSVDAQSASSGSIKDVDEKGIAFIFCANDENYVREVVDYLKRQNVPKDYRVSAYIIYNAKSMTQGYNIGMKLSNARYKIYTHQDTFIFDPDYTWNLIQELREKDYHMLGVAGAGKMSPDGVWWNCNPMDKHMCLYQDMVISMLCSVTESKEKTSVETECLDGVLIATDRDMEWREDLFNNFHFYDVSQSYAFFKKGYKVGVYNNERVGVLHEVSVSKNPHTEREYEISRLKFEQKYLMEKII